MANAAVLALTNGLGTTVNYSPMKVITGDESVFIDLTSSVPAAQSRATIRMKENGSTRRVTCRTVLPVWDAVGLKVAYVLLAENYFLRPVQATNAEATDLRRRQNSLCAHSVVTAMFDTGEAIW